MFKNGTDLSQHLIDAAAWMAQRDVQTESEGLAGVITQSIDRAVKTKEATKIRSLRDLERAVKLRDELLGRDTAVGQTKLAFAEPIKLVFVGEDD